MNPAMKAFGGVYHYGTVFLKTSLTKDYTSNCGFHWLVKRASVSAIQKLMIYDS